MPTGTKSDEHNTPRPSEAEAESDLLASWADGHPDPLKVRRTDGARHIAPDFLDPLAAQIGKEMCKPTLTVESFEDLSYILVAIVGGVGSDAVASDWGKAENPLEARSRRDLEKLIWTEAKEVFERSNIILQRLRERGQLGSIDPRIFQTEFAKRLIRKLDDWSQNLKKIVSRIGRRRKPRRRTLSVEAQEHHNEIKAKAENAKMYNEQWMTGNWNTIEELAKAMGADPMDVKRGIDRYRKRGARMRQKLKRNPMSHKFHPRVPTPA